MKILGLKEQKVNEILSLIEDRMLETNIGQQLVGVYPYGPRIYGLQDQPLHLLCLVLNDPSELLNPIETKAKKSMTTKVEGIICHYYDLYYWIRLITSEDVSYPVLLPTLFYKLYEDNSIYTIMKDVHSYFRTINYIYPFPSTSAFFEEGITNIEGIGIIRSLYMLVVGNGYSTNLNKRLEDVSEPKYCNEQLNKLDANIVESVSSKPDFNITAEILLDYTNLLDQEFESRNLVPGLSKLQLQKMMMKKENLGHEMKMFLMALI